MTVAIKPSDFIDCQDAVQPPSLDTLRIAFLDTFLEFEVAINKWLIKLDKEEKYASASVGQRLDCIAKADLTGHATPKQVKRIAEHLANATRILNLRNAMIHGKTELGTLGCSPALLIRNTADIAAGRPLYLVVTIADFEVDRKSVVSMTGKLVEWLTPPLPPQPKPDAAAGP